VLLIFPTWNAPQYEDISLHAYLMCLCYLSTYCCDDSQKEADSYHLLCQGVAHVSMHEAGGKSCGCRGAVQVGGQH
jgi:hypothetical protein